jgi:hypothetical protein
MEDCGPRSGMSFPICFHRSFRSRAFCRQSGPLAPKAIRQSAGPELGRLTGVGSSKSRKPSRPVLRCAVRWPTGSGSRCGILGRLVNGVKVVLDSRWSEATIISTGAASPVKHRATAASAIEVYPSPFLLHPSGLIDDARSSWEV